MSVSKKQKVEEMWHHFPHFQVQPVIWLVNHKLLLVNHKLLLNQTSSNRQVWSRPFFFFFSVELTQRYVIFRCTTWWFNFSLPCALLTTSGAPICHTQRYYDSIDCIHYVLLPVTYAIQCVPPTPLYLFCPSSHCPSLWKPSLCSLYL